MESDLYESTLRGKDKIGRGSFGTVFKGHQKNHNRTPVAIKRIENDADYITKNAMKDFKAMLAVCGHENIVQLLELDLQPDFIYIIMEYCNRGDLEKFLSEGVPSYRVKLDIMRQCATGVSYIHGLSPPVVHRDLKPQNILLTESPSGLMVKICDFGMAKVFSDMIGTIAAMYMSTRGAGTLPFIAPEMWVSELHYTAMVDNYSLGLVFAMIVNYNDNNKERIPHTADVAREPYLSFGQRQLQEHNESRTPPSLYLCPQFAENHPRMKSLIVQMTSFDAKKRTKMQKVESEIAREISDMKATGSNTDIPTEFMPTQKLSSSGSKAPVTHPPSGTRQGGKADTPQPETGAKPKQYQQKKPKTSQASPVEVVKVRKQPTVGASPISVPHPVSCRRTDGKLSSMKQLTPVKEGSFKIRNLCWRICYHNNIFYFPCVDNQCIDCYSMEGSFIRSISLSQHQVGRLWSVHPLTGDSLLVAAGSGLFKVGTGEGGECRRVLQVICEDVHVSEGVVAVLVGGNLVHILQASDLSSPVSTVTLPHSEARTVLLHQGSVYVSSGGYNSAHQHISVYSLRTGELTSRWGRGAARELWGPRLSACDAEGGLLVVDTYNHRLQTLSARGKWAVLPGLGEVRWPDDAIKVGDRMLVLDGVDGDQNVHAYQIIYKSISELTKEASISDSKTCLIS